MKVEDFGRFDGPVVLFGGAYSNLQALEAFVEAARDAPVISTGDLVAYCAQPNETVSLFRDLGWPTIAGNCEEQLAEGRDDCGCGFGADTTCDLLSRGWYAHLSAAGTPEMAAWMGDLPQIGTFEADGKRFAVVHGGATAINRFLWPSTPDSAFEEEIALIEQEVGAIDGVIAGHCGVAFHRMIGRHQWINAGAIGLPPHDGRPLTRYAVLENGEATFHNLGYDHATARAKMEEAELSQGYEVALTTGIWPSEDVLPDALRR